MATIEKTTLSELSNILEQSEHSEMLDLGATVLVRCKHAVMGDLITVSDANGGCALIRP